MEGVKLLNMKYENLHWLFDGSVEIISYYQYDELKNEKVDISLCINEKSKNQNSSIYLKNELFY